MATNVLKTSKNCFAPLVNDDRTLLKPIEFEKTKKVYVLVPYSEQVGDDPENIVLKYKPVLKEEYDIDEYIDSFSDEVGIQNILKKISISGDKSLLNQTHREPLCEGVEPIQDYSNVPVSKAEAFEAVRKGVQAYDNLPEDIKQKMSFAQFAQGFGEADIESYVNKVIAANTAAAEGGNQ